MGHVLHALGGLQRAHALLQGVDAGLVLGELVGQALVFAHGAVELLGGRVERHAGDHDARQAGEGHGGAADELLGVARGCDDAGCADGPLDCLPAGRVGVALLGRGGRGAGPGACDAGPACGGALARGSFGGLDVLLFGGELLGGLGGLGCLSGFGLGGFHRAVCRALCALGLVRHGGSRLRLMRSAHHDVHLRADVDGAGYGDGRVGLRRDVFLPGLRRPLDCGGGTFAERFRRALGRLGARVRRGVHVLGKALLIGEVYRATAKARLRHLRGGRCGVGALGACCRLLWGHGCHAWVSSVGRWCGCNLGVVHHSHDSDRLRLYRRVVLVSIHLLRKRCGKVLRACQFDIFGRVCEAGL